jgi:hypothetical protein
MEWWCDMAQLRNLQVEFVSLVSKAATRNPAKPDEAQRFLLLKSEQGETMSNMEKAAEKLAEHEAGSDRAMDRVMNAVNELRKHDDGSMDPIERFALRKRSQGAELAYLEHVSPAGAAAYMSLRKAEAESDDNSDDDADDQVGEDDLIDRAASLRKADPSLSEFESLRRAARA